MLPPKQHDRPNEKESDEAVETELKHQHGGEEGRIDHFRITIPHSPFGMNRNQKTAIGDIVLFCFFKKNRPDADAMIQPMKTMEDARPTEDLLNAAQQSHAMAP